MLNGNLLIGSHNVLFLTLDTLRYDVACQMLKTGQTPQLAALLPDGQWEARHTPGSFTYAAHQSFFAGFLPTPVTPGPHPRLFATAFAGSETITQNTFVFNTPDIVTGFASVGYHTICIGGVGFFNKLTPLGSVLPNLFAESYWDPSLGVTHPNSTRHQVKLACERLNQMAANQRIFLFVNISALHQPNFHYLPGAKTDSAASQGAALAYVDSQLPPLFSKLRQRGPVLVMICSDHGTAYGEDGFYGHRLGHPVVWTVPYAEFVLAGQTP
ncbi:MAG: STM4013/SEN3800 family hydrolase [Acidobacteria bacterium]|nr:STM4013/SEN3800 family hydrolase [Acidobacteriota bacterium]